MSKFHAFGCSYTSMCWPTWADWCALSLPHLEYHNWGIPGASNTAILQHMQYAKNTGVIQPGDVIAVVWTSTDRQEFWRGNCENAGNVANIYPPSSEYWRYWTPETGLLNSYMIWQSARSEFSLAFEGHLTYRDDGHSPPGYWSVTPTPENVDLPNSWQNVHHSGELYELVKLQDGHPTPDCTLAYAREYAIPAVGGSLPQNAQHIVDQFAQLLTDAVHSVNRLPHGSAERAELWRKHTDGCQQLLTHLFPGERIIYDFPATQAVYTSYRNPQ